MKRGERMFRLELETGNAAFGGDPAGEIAGILDDIAGALREGLLSQESATIKDTNGNTVGQWQYTPEEDSRERQSCGQRWVAEIAKCPRCGLGASEHDN